MRRVCPASLVLWSTIQIIKKVSISNGCKGLTFQRNIVAVSVKKINHEIRQITMVTKPNCKDLVFVL